MARVNEVLDWYLQNGYEIQAKPYSDSFNYSYELNQALDNLSDIKDWDGYTQREKSFLLTKIVQTNASVKPMLKTTWSQKDPFNNQLPYPNDDNKNELGCVPVAIAQLMRYYEKPYKNYDYSQMPYSWSSYTTQGIKELGEFLRQVGEDLGINYYNEDRGRTIDQAKKFLKNNGFSNISDIDYDFYKIKPYLDYGPIYLRSNIEGESSGHAWVCDGYGYTSVETEYLIITYNGNYMDATAFQCFDTVYSYSNGSANQSLHMKWGWDYGYGDGYYSNNVWKVDFPSSSNNMNTNRKALVGFQ